MKVFISWSGIRSKKVAELLNKWIPDVIQAVTTWISSEDIEKGTIWFNEITETLKQTNVGIICLTLENKDKPWILFESGALLNKLTKAHVYTFLFDLAAEEVEKPLAEFNHTFPMKDDMFKLLKSINSQLGESKLTTSRLQKAFDKNWPDFELPFADIKAIKLEKKVEAEPRSDDSMMKEILLTTRALEQRLRDGEQNDLNLPPSLPRKKVINIAKLFIEKNKDLAFVMRNLQRRGVSCEDAYNAFYLAKGYHEQKDLFNESMSS